MPDKRPSVKNEKQYEALTAQHKAAGRKGGRATARKH
jgi:hypothetical protein